MLKYSSSERERFDAKWVEAEEPHPILGTKCWLWTAGTLHGYGQFSCRRTIYRSRTQRAHRISYEMYVGPIPEGLQLDHLCRVRRCVNPEHLEPVTCAENVRRGRAGEAFALAQMAKTHCPQGHAYAGSNLYVPPSGGRYCRICVRRRQRAAYAANRIHGRAQHRASYHRNKHKHLSTP